MTGCLVKQKQNNDGAVLVIDDCVFANLWLVQLEIDREKIISYSI